MFIGDATTGTREGVIVGETSQTLFANWVSLMGQSQGGWVVFAACVLCLLESVPCSTNYYQPVPPLF